MSTLDSTVLWFCIKLLFLQVNFVFNFLTFFWGKKAQRWCMFIFRALSHCRETLVPTVVLWLSSRPLHNVRCLHCDEPSRPNGSVRWRHEFMVLCFCFWAPGCKQVWMLQPWSFKDILIYREDSIPRAAIEQLWKLEPQWKCSALKRKVSWVVRKPGYTRAITGQFWRLEPQ